MAETTSFKGWNEQIDCYHEEVNRTAGVTKPSPEVATGPYSFPLVSRFVTQDLIRLFAAANGDRNPLWSDSDYAAATRWGLVIAPPVFEASLSEHASLPDPPQVPGWNSLAGGTRRRYFEPFRPGFVMQAEDTWCGQEEKSDPSKPYRLFKQVSERSFLNQDGRVVCSIQTRNMCTATPPNDDGSVGVDYSGRVRRRYSADELAEIQSEYDRELAGLTHRGAEPRWWEDVEVGDELPTIAKGPYDILDAVALVAATGNGVAFASKWAQMRGDLARRPVDGETGAPHHAISWHFLDSIAQASGIPYAHVFGTHLEMMLAHPVTNWMGDDAFVRELDTQLRRVMFHGDVARAGGRVARKYREGDEHLVELELSLVQQDGLTIAKGSAAVALPSRSGRPLGG